MTELSRRAIQVLWSAAAAFALASSSAAFAQQQQWQWTTGARIVVFADVHGAYAELVGLLEATGIVDDALGWTGRDTHLVSLGDLLDRGPDSRKVMDLLMRLQREAAMHGGAVHVVLGNHEVMNLVGDVRYVSGAEYAAFAAEEPAEAREAAYERFLAEQPQPVAESDARAAFEQRYPPGYFGHRLAFAADGRYGDWLLSLPAVVVINGMAFLHGGLSAVVANIDLAGINERVTRSLRRYLAIREQLADADVLPRHDMSQDLDVAQDALRAITNTEAQAADGDLSSLLEEFLALGDAPELGVDGPLWYRGSIYCNPLIEGPTLSAALAQLDAERLIVGHTPSANRRARALYDGRLVMLDTGMLKEYYSGRPAALVIDGDEISVQYLAPPERLPLEAGRIEAYGLTEAQILDALTAGAVEPVDADQSGSRGRQVTVRHGGEIVRAVFYPDDRERAARLELAAHGLDRLLGLDLVPPTVARSIDGTEGALQLEYPDAITEAERIEGKPLREAWCDIGPQLNLMYAFDALTYNTGRTRDNILYRGTGGVVKLVDHAQSFGAERRVRLAGGAMSLSPELERALRSLDQPQLNAAIGRWIDTSQIRAVLARRDAIIKQAERD